MTYAIAHANSIQIIDGIYFLKLDYLSKYLATLSIDLLTMYKEFYRNSIADSLLKEEEEKIKKNNGEKNQTKKIDIEDIEIKIESNGEEDEKAKNTEFYNDFFNEENYESTLIISTATSRQKKKRRKRKGKKQITSQVNDIIIASNQNGEVTNAITADNAKEGSTHENSTNDKPETILKEEIKIQKKEIVASDEVKTTKKSAKKGNKGSPKKEEIICHEKIDSTIKIEEPIKVIKEKGKDIAKTKKEYEKLKAQALEMFSAATTTASKTYIKKPSKKNKSSQDSESKIEQANVGSPIKQVETPKLYKNLSSEEAKFTTPKKKQNKEKNPPRLNSDQYEKNRWRKYSDEAKKKQTWKSPKENIIYRKKESMHQTNIENYDELQQEIDANF